MADAVETVFDMIKKHEVAFVDLRFTDLNGKWRQSAQTAATVTEALFAGGVRIDGASMAGGGGLRESDLTLRPDPATAALDPFSAQPELILICDVIDSATGRAVVRDPRATAHRAGACLQSSGIGEVALFGAEIAFFVFDDVRWSLAANHSFYEIDSEEGRYNSSKAMDGGNPGHRPAIGGGYCSLPPVDSLSDLRAEMVTTLAEMGVAVERHDHAVASSQGVLGLKPETLTRSADNLQACKYVVHQVAHAYGKTATFMPKPVIDEDGSGMATGQSILKAGESVFADAGAGGGDLSETARHYIGGLLAHGRALNAFTNPTTNSYKRLRPGTGAPVRLACSAHDRAAACRIRSTAGAGAARIELRFPDPAANPYLAFSAMLMAGLDGIERRLDPGQAIDEGGAGPSSGERGETPRLCRSLREAVEALDGERTFLTRGGVFTDDQIDAYLDLKRAEIAAVDRSPHPVEYDLYYSL